MSGIRPVGYDLVAIQEISQLPDDTEVCGPHTESAICDLQAAANAARGAYGLAVSPRIGDEQHLAELPRLSM